MSASPFYIDCRVSSTDPSKTQLSGSAITNAVAGNVESFIVTQYDSGSNQRDEGGDVLVVTIASASYAASGIEIFDRDDGTYLVTYKIINAAEVYILQVTTNGDSANTKTSTITVVANVPDAITSTLSASTPLTIDDGHTFSLQIFDRYNNPV